MPLLPCPHCDQKVSVAISQAGSQVKCQGCQQVIPVPKLGELKRIASEEAASGMVSESVAANAISSDSQAGKRVLFGGLLAIAGVAAIVGLFCLVRYLSVDVPATTEMHIAEIDQVFHQSPAAQLVREFQEMEKFNLDASAPYNYKKLEKEKSRWARNSLIAAGVLGLSMAVAIYLGLSDKRRGPAI